MEARRLDADCDAFPAWRALQRPCGSFHANPITTEWSGLGYSLPVTSDWAATLHTDFYWQAESWARVENDNPYDRLRGYTSVNLALVLTDQSGWQVMGYVKNLFDTTAITGDFLNSDDSGLTTNIFLTDPRLFGVRVTKHFDGGSLPGGMGLDFFPDSVDRRPQVWMQLGGNFDVMNVGQQAFSPSFSTLFPSDLPSPPPRSKRRRISASTGKVASPSSLRIPIGY